MKNGNSYKIKFSKQLAGNKNFLIFACEYYKKGFWAIPLIISERVSKCITFDINESSKVIHFGSQNSLKSFIYKGFSLVVICEYR